MVSCISINISNTKGEIIFKNSEQFTCFTVITFVPRFTALAGARIYVAVFTVDIWTGYWTISSIVFSWKASFEKVMSLYFSLEYMLMLISFKSLQMFLTRGSICQICHRGYQLVKLFLQDIIIIPRTKCFLFPSIEWLHYN